MGKVHYRGTQCKAKDNLPLQHLVLFNVLLQLFPQSPKTRNYRLALPVLPTYHQVVASQTGSSVKVAFGPPARAPLPFSPKAPPGVGAQSIPRLKTPSGGSSSTDFWSTASTLRLNRARVARLLNVRGSV